MPEKFSANCYRQPQFAVYQLLIWAGQKCIGLEPFTLDFEINLNLMDQYLKQFMITTQTQATRDFYCSFLYYQDQVSQQDNSGHVPSSFLDLLFASAAIVFPDVVLICQAELICEVWKKHGPEDESHSSKTASLFFEHFGSLSWLWHESYFTHSQVAEDLMTLSVYLGNMRDCLSRYALFLHGARAIARTPQPNKENVFFSIQCAEHFQKTNYSVMQVESYLRELAEKEKMKRTTAEFEEGDTEA